VDDRSAHSALTDGAISLTMPFTFDERGLIDTVRAEARGRSGGRAKAGRVVQHRGPLRDALELVHGR
jgi:hypothetical protein